ncbi:uncharacterized protein EV154DRAFT_561841 [Mucor mucedo]|uniref:uncharacterized protein n=1 Tax=Mucor mucedo TaxID=29922 RepID=UPI00221EAEBF|nr:uncharacterized protein EV154DRAFT_561841 [Mucor mucedo]KAI7892924.1 hypothetical protein EV154DRAFT_561841 [Mucor mucedo]
MTKISTFVTFLVICILCFHASCTAAGGLKLRYRKRSLGALDVKEAIKNGQNFLTGIGAVTEHTVKGEIGSLKAKEDAASRPGSSPSFGTSTADIASGGKTVK